MTTSLIKLNKQIISCKQCKRLVSFREKIATEKIIITASFHLVKIFNTFHIYIYRTKNIKLFAYNFFSYFSR